MHNTGEEQLFAELTPEADSLRLNLESLDQVQAFYSLQIQEHRLLIEQLRNAKCGNSPAAALISAANDIPPTDFAIRRNKAA